MNDQRILVNVILKRGFKVLNNRYYLNNVGYINIRNILIFFKRIKYYLYKIIIAKDVLKIYQEFFNLRYSTLRNKIKRIFKVLKYCFLFL
jgi:hypothetical protein